MDATELANQMLWWHRFHMSQVEFDLTRGEEQKAINFNNEFLLVYVIDLILSMPTHQSLVANTASKIAIATTLIDRQVHHRAEIH